MTARPDWMPSDAEMYQVGTVDNHEGGQEANLSDIELICRRTGLRAQIAVLEEMQEADHGTDLSMCDDSAGWYADLVDKWIERKIATLRKELSND